MKAPEYPKLITRGERKGQMDTGESEEQIAFGKWVVSEGGLYGVFYSWSTALRAIMWYLGFEHSKEWALD
jgi:hypothetical protein